MHCLLFPDQPFSNGLVTVMVPQLRRENSLLLWSTLELNSPVHTFVGHDDVVLEFQWRPQKEGESSSECERRNRENFGMKRFICLLSKQKSKPIYNTSVQSF